MINDNTEVEKKGVTKFLASANKSFLRVSAILDKFCEDEEADIDRATAVCDLIYKGAQAMKALKDKKTKVEASADNPMPSKSKSKSNGEQVAV